MRDRQWNLITIIFLLSSGLLACLMLVIYFNPYSFLNPLPPPELPELLVLPTATATFKQLPNVWTPTPMNGVKQNNPNVSTLKPSSTLVPTSTGFRLPSATPTSTNTPTETNTPTMTNTPRPSSTPTRTNTFTATFTLIPSDTLESPTDTSVPPTNTVEIPYP